MLVKPHAILVSDEESFKIFLFMILIYIASNATTVHTTDITKSNYPHGVRE